MKTTLKQFKPGDKIRSFDFDSKDLEGNNACYIEGVVEAITEHPVSGGGRYYKFKCTRKIFGGKEIKESIGDEVYAPLNGMKTWTGEELNQVEKI